MTDGSSGAYTSAPAPSADRWAVPLSIVVGLVAVASMASPADVGHGYFSAIRALLCSGCLVVGIRRWRVMTGTEIWILSNLAAVYNPIWPFHLHYRQAWALLGVATALSLSRLMFRTDRPEIGWRAGLAGVLVGVYAFSLVADALLDANSASQAARDVLRMPLSLLGPSVGLYLAVGWSMVATQATIRALRTRSSDR